MGKLETLDDYVEDVDYGESYINYHPSTESLQFVNLVNLIYGDQLENITPTMHYQMFDAMFGIKDICIVAHRGSGKALGLDEVVYKEDGSTVTVRDVKLGDKILAPDGSTTTVIWKSKIFSNETYDIELEDGRKVNSCKHHFWKVNKIKKPTDNYRLTTEEIRDRYRISMRDKMNKKGSSEFTFRIENTAPLEYKNSYNPVVDAQYMGTFLAGKDITGPASKQIFLAYDLGSLSLTTNKRDYHIPDLYKRSSLKYRFKLLDSIVFNKTGGKSLLNIKESVALHVTGKKLAEDISEIARSLGMYSSVTHAYSRSTVKLNINKNYSTIRNVKSKGIQPTQCISVDHPTKQFLTTDYVATMNSTSMAQNLFFYLAIYEELPRIGKVDFAIYVSDTVDNGCKTMTHNMEYTWENSPFLRQLIPKAKFTMGRWTMTNMNGHELIIRTYGALTGIRGGREKNKRPKLAVIDDVLSDTTAVSESKLDSIKDTIFKAIEEAMHPSALQILIGTPFHSKCVVSEAVASGNYTNIVFPICEKFPCTREEFRGSWEDRFPYDVVLKKYNKAKNGKGKSTLQGFYQELMLTPTSKDRRMVEPTMFGLDTQSKFLNAPYGKWNFYITTDFATSDKDSGDYSFILVWAYGDDGKMYIVDGYCGKQLMDKNIDELFRLVAKWKPQQVGVEINGQQGGFVPWIRREMKLRGIHFRFASSDVKDNTGNDVSGKDGIRSSGNKMTRFSVVYPDVARGNFVFMQEHVNEDWYKELIKELCSIIPEGITSAHDDGIDAFSQIQYIKLNRTYFTVVPSDLDVIAEAENHKVNYFKSRQEDLLGYNNVNSYTVQG